MKLVIAEKPSVAISIAGVIGANKKQDGYYEGGGYLVSWCYGHLVEPANADAYDEKYRKWAIADLPILPEPWQYEVTADKKKQFKVLAGLMKDKRVDSLVCATDAGREGELIFRLVYLQAGCKKPFERLWISSMEDAAIRDGFANLKPGTEYDNLFASALSRAQADWIVGINASRLFSCLYGASLNVGRVQSPTLAMMVQRAGEIQDFKKEKYYHVHINPGGADATGERIKTKKEADAMQAACDKKQAVLSSLATEQKTVNPPKLFDLTSLQREANRLYGYTAQQTLDYAQALYEKKLLTYPRTDSQYLTADMADTATDVAAMVYSKIPFAAKAPMQGDMGRVVNDKKVSDHHAIIPTASLAGADLASIPASECNILTLVAARLLCATAAPHIYEAVTAVFTCEGHEFKARGRTVQTPGWKEIDALYRATLKEKPKEDKDEKDGDKALPELAEGQTFDAVDATISEHTTKPPKPYTEDTLLSAMERAGNEETDPDAERMGLGTPATRAGVIEKLVHKGFVKREKKQLIPTEKGINLIRILPDTLTSAKLTAEWENALTEIAKGKYTAPVFMAGIVELTRAIIKENPTPSDELKQLFPNPVRPVVGPCPRCGGDVHEGKRNFYCGNRECKFAMWKNDRFFENKKKALTADLAAKLLNDGKAPLKGFYSAKTGNRYDATVVLADTGQYVNYKLEFPPRKK